MARDREARARALASETRPRTPERADRPRAGAGMTGDLIALDTRFFMSAPAVAAADPHPDNADDWGHLDDLALQMLTDPSHDCALVREQWHSFLEREGLIKNPADLRIRQLITRGPSLMYRA